jgi:apolipoprotein D and lipocalin family protein
MNNPPPPLPASLPRAEAPPPVDLDDRILEVEQRLIAREAQLRRGVAALGQQLHTALQPRRLVRPAMVAALALGLLLGRPWRRRGAPAPAQPQPHGAAPVVRPALIALLAGLPWARLLGQAWPLLPARWRGRVSPATAASVLRMGLPLLEHLFARRSSDEPARPR